MTNEELAKRKQSFLEELRTLGIAGKYGAAGAVGGVPDVLGFAMNTPSYLANLAGYDIPQPYEYITPKIVEGIDSVTGNTLKPQTFNQKALGTGAEFLASGKATAIPKAASKIGKFIAPQGEQAYASLFGAGVGTEAGRELFPDSAAAQFAAGLAGGLTPGALSALSPNQLAQNVASKALGINPQSAQAFKDANLTPTLADLSDSKFIKGAQNVAVQAPFVGTPISNSIKNTKEQIAKYGEGLTQINAGELAQRGLRDWQTKGSQVAAELQKRMARFMTPSEGIVVDKTLDAIRSAPKFSTAEAKSQFANSAVGKEYNKLAGIAEKNNGTVPYEDLVYFRQQIDDQINNFGLLGFNKEQGSLKNLRTQIQQDIGQAFKGKGDAAYNAFEKHNKFYTAFARKNEDIVNGLIKNKTATEAFKSIVGDLKIDAKKADAVLGSLKPEQKQVFSKSLISELGQSPQNEFNPSYLATNFKKLEPQAQEVVLGSFTPEGKKQFRATIDAIDAMKSTKAEANPSGTFNQTLKLGTVGGLLTEPVTTGSLLLGGRLTAGLMTSPKFLKWLSEAPRLQDEAQVAKHLGSLAKIGIDSPQIAPDIARYLEDVEADDELRNLSDEELMQLYNNQEDSGPVAEELSPEMPNEEQEYLNSLSDEELMRLYNEAETPQAESIPQLIDSSAAEAGLNPAFVQKVAQVESGLNPNARNPNSSASGLFQFTNSTWREVVNKYGKEYGVTVRDKNDPQANAQMAALYLRDNANKLARVLGREPSQGEVYATHFLGLGGANKLIKNYGKGQIAAALFPREAKANRSVFYQNGRPITVEELYNYFSKQMSY
jgi:hypothetical protein